MSSTMKVYVVRRPDAECDYDQYDAIAVAAKNEDDAFELAHNAAGDRSKFKRSTVEITEVSQEVPGVVLASFRAG